MRTIRAILVAMAVSLSLVSVSHADEVDQHLAGSLVAGSAGFLSVALPLGIGTANAVTDVIPMAFPAWAIATGAYLEFVTACEARGLERNYPEKWEKAVETQHSVMRLSCVPKGTAPVKTVALAPWTYDANGKYICGRNCE